MPTIPQFTPCYILPNELAMFGLPNPGESGDIMSLIRGASTLIDRECGRIDIDGQGSLVYSTYEETLLLQNPNQNLVQLSHKPIVALSQAKVDALINAIPSGSGALNYTYTGVQASTITMPDSSLSGILAASGRFGYERSDIAVAYPDLYTMVNPGTFGTLFGGPTPFTPIDVSACTYNAKFGEVWIPPGILLTRYTEVSITYTSGFDPNNMPMAIKQACAMIVKGMLVRGDATAGLLEITLGRGINTKFSPGLIDITVDAYLQPFKTIVGR